jgi:hypothetical protein
MRGLTPGDNSSAKKFRAFLIKIHNSSILTTSKPLHLVTVLWSWVCLEEDLESHGHRGHRWGHLGPK